ncbi:MAG: DEAD/DEAH box helicase [Desulfobacter sp.]|nr:MAG: DEAD/DEAH box helicase [Desulfobacter sp.]
MSEQQTMPGNGFDQMSLSAPVRSAVADSGYHTPTPIQDQTIPLLLNGKDLVGQARTGTGKTAAFALPLLSRIDLDLRRPQVLVLTPTRELAIQVAKSFETYGSKMKGLSVLPVYGGQSYGIQLKALKKGVHVVVGTPGRLMDHIQRKTLSLAHLFAKVLDEADEMLHMGFIDDVEWIFDHTPEETQTALFSATMPRPIRKIADKYLRDPETVTIKADTSGTDTITQEFWMVKGASKSSALIRFLDALTFDGVIVFARTKAATIDITKELEGAGYRAEALNGDMAQNAREAAIERLKRGRTDILVATDVAARGLDVERISHVINYDLPDKTEPYIHRIGRTGRAGRTGNAILFVRPRERWMVRKIEKAVGRELKQVNLPSDRAVNKKRIKAFNAAITKALESPDLDIFEDLAADYAETTGVPITKVAAALGKLTHGDGPFLMEKKQMPQKDTRKARSDKASSRKSSAGRDRDKKSTNKQAPRPIKDGMERYRIEVGRSHGVKPRDIVGAIANEAGLKSRFITGITINTNFSEVDLPRDMPTEIFHLLRKTWVRSRPMEISKVA